MEEYIQIFTTTKKKEDAGKIAKILVEKRLAGCIQILPVTSTYWWKGNVETEEEWLCLIKGKKALYKELEKTIMEIHPYEIPEIIAVPIIAGSDDYLKWLNNELKKE